MLRDRYENAMTTTSQGARDAYIAGVDSFLAAGPDGERYFREAIAEDPGFALAHVALARQLQMLARGPEALEALAKANELAANLTERERAHIGIFELMLTGQGAAALEAIQRHALTYPRDAMVMQPAVGVFGLIGFSGQPGREAEQLAFTGALVPHYGEDWWMLGSHAFSQVEAGQTARAAETVERSLALQPRNANAAHYKAHIHYEAGETEAGYAYMADWRVGYRKESLLHCHIAWHVALWALERGDTDFMWQVIDADVSPSGAWGPPINVLTDTASILCRAQLAGVDVPQSRWQGISAYAAKLFPKPGIAFADVHASLAHAMAGNGEALQTLISEAKGPAGDLVSTLASAFQAFAAQNWAKAQSLFARTLSDHYRIGGSKAQRDLIEYALLGCLLKQGETEKAQFLLSTRRPLKADAHAVSGL